MVCLDVDYRSDGVVAACVGFADWGDAAPAFETTLAFEEPPESYESGQFYRRELPYLLALLRSLAAPPALVVIDGFVWLDRGRPGLGAHLADAWGRHIPIIGVAKRPFHEADAVPLLRGASRVPLYISASAHSASDAAAHIAAMHGEHRIPTLLKRVDRLARGG